MPNGYVNISGNAYLCTGDCNTCSVTVSNCTSCKTMSLDGNACVSPCPLGTISVNVTTVGQICQSCLSPCATCSLTTTNCTACNASLSPLMYLNGNTCQTICPNLTYANGLSLTCSPCLTPCSLCSSATTCLSCATNYSLYNTSCLPTCPSGFTGVAGQCLACTSNCKTCSGATNVCVLCNNGSYFLNSSSSCVTSCGTGLFIDYDNQLCVGCTSPCNTCINSSTTCTACIPNYYYLANQCLPACPAGMYVQANANCLPCPTNCSSCTATANCSACAGNTYLYNGACITACPAAYAVVVDGACTACTTQFCATCSPANACLTCRANYLYFNAVCLANCTTGYVSNGTHCISAAAAALNSAITTPTTFPVPFSIAAAVLLIACLMSRLQFGQTYLSGAVYSLFGLLELLALIYFLYLYWADYYNSQPIPFFIGIAALAYLYTLNIVAAFAQGIFLCYEREFAEWKQQSRFHKCFYVLVSILSITFTHKLRNILFCKLFTFRIFSAKLERVDHFRIFNVFSLLSLGHSGAAIFSAAVALKYINGQEQVFYESVDVIVLTAVNVLMAFFNTHKDKDFFQEMTNEGFSLHKKNQLDEDHFPDKIQPGGNDAEIEAGFLNDYNHALASKQALMFDEGSLNDYSDASLGPVSESNNEPKEYE